MTLAEALSDLDRIALRDYETPEACERVKAYLLMQHRIIEQLTLLPRTTITLAAVPAISQILDA